MTKEELLYGWLQKAAGLQAGRAANMAIGGGIGKRMSCHQAASAGVKACRVGSSKVLPCYDRFAASRSVSRRGSASACVAEMSVVAKPAPVFVFYLSLAQRPASQAVSWQAFLAGGIKSSSRVAAKWRACMI